jgi:hypothetical protein
MSISEKASSNSKTAVPLSVVVPTALSVVQIDTTISPDAVSATVTLGFAVVLLVAVWVPSEVAESTKLIPPAYICTVPDAVTRIV